MSGWRKKFFVLCLLILFISFYLGGETPQPIRESLGPFNCESASGETITEKEISARSVRYLIYGNPDSLENNRKTLDSILEAIRGKKQIENLMYIVDFRGYPGILNLFIRENLKSNEKQMGIKIFADWSGRIALNQSLEKNKAYFLVINDSLEIEKIMSVDRTDEVKNILLNL